MNVKRVTLFSLLFLIIGVNITFGASASDGVAILEGPLVQFYKGLQSENVVSTLVIIFLFMLLYGIYVSALRFVPVFQGENNGVSRQGKIIGVSLAALSVIPLIVLPLLKGVKPIDVVKPLLDPFGIFAGLALAALFAGITYFGIRGASPESSSFAWTAAAAGFGMVIGGLIVTKGTMVSWGFLIMLIAMIAGLTMNGFGGGSSDGNNTTSTTTTTNPDGTTTTTTTNPDGTTTTTTTNPDGKDKTKDDGLDHVNRGDLIVHVMDKNNKGIEGVRVIVTPDKMFGKQLYSGKTNKEGKCPPDNVPVSIASGYVKIIVKKEAWRMYVLPYNIFRSDRFRDSTRFYIKPGELNQVTIKLERYGKNVVFFNPKVQNVEITSKNNIKLTGRIDGEIVEAPLEDE